MIRNRPLSPVVKHGLRVIDPDREIAKLHKQSIARAISVCIAGGAFPDPHEGVIKGEFQKLKAAADDSFGRELRTAVTGVPRLVEHVRCHALQELQSRAEQTAKTLPAAMRPLLVDRATKVQKARWRLRAAELEYDRPASGADAGGYLAHIALLIGFVAVEGLGNCYFFGIADRLGIVGGLIRAMGIAALSVWLSFNAGIVLRAVFEHSCFGKGVCVLGAVAFSSGLLSFHGLVAHYRDLLVVGQDPLDATLLAIQTFAANGLHYHDVWSLFLLLVGVSFGIFAAVTGWQSLDARIAARLARLLRHLEKAKQDHEDACNHARDDTDQSAQRHIAEAEAIRDDGLAALEELMRKVADGHAIVERYRATLRKLENDYRRAIAFFRNAMAHILAVAPPALSQLPPPELDAEPTLDLTLLTEAKAARGDPSERQQDISDRVAAVKAAIAGMFRRAREEIEAIVETLRDVTEETVVRPLPTVPVANLPALLS